MRALMLSSVILLAACGGSQTTRVQDGGTLAEALVLRGGAGAMDPKIAEYEWIRAHRPDARVVGEGRMRQGGRVYDVVRIVRRGRPEQLYFDVTEAIGG
jgi:hypothetical protein